LFDCNLIYIENIYNINIIFFCYFLIYNRYLLVVIHISNSVGTDRTIIGLINDVGFVYGKPFWGTENALKVSRTASIGPNL